jgi:predicted dehydrogenase
MACADAKVRVIVVGCGDIAEQEHLPALARSADAELVGLVDVDDTARNRLAARHGVPGARAVADAAAWRPDAAIVATPPEITPGLTRDLLGLGLHVLCEKPMAVDPEAARAVHETAVASGRIVQVGFVNRFSPLIVHVRDWLRAGRLGHPLVFALTTYDERYDPADQAHYRRIMHFLEHGPAFLHEAAHQTDYVFHLGGGTVTEVRALGVATRPEFPADNYTAALVRYDNGNVARLEVGWMFPELPASDFRIVGPLGTVRVNRREGWAELAADGATERVALDRPWTEASFDGQLAAFVSAVRSGRPHGPGTADGLASLDLCHEVVTASAGAGRH